MIVDDEQSVDDLEEFIDAAEPCETTPSEASASATDMAQVSLSEFIRKRYEMQSATAHRALQKAIIEHMWNIRGEAE